MEEVQVNWRKDPLREVLRGDVRSGRIPPTMWPRDARKIRPEYVAMDKKLFSQRLKGARIAVANEEQPQKTKKEKWGKNNKTRIQLHDDMAVGLIPPTMDAATARKKREAYEAIEYTLWKSRFDGMRKIVDEKLARAKSDKEDLESDLALYIRPTHNARGEPDWNYHEAADLLEIDVDDGKHENKTPKELWHSRLQYQDFSLTTFRGHLHQEIQARKWRSQWVDGRKEYALVNPPSYD